MPETPANKKRRNIITAVVMAGVAASFYLGFIAFMYSQ